MHDPVTWYKITYAGVQVAKRDFQNNATRTSPPGPAFVLEVPLRNLRTSMCEFVPCDRIVQRACWFGLRLVCKENSLVITNTQITLIDQTEFSYNESIASVINEIQRLHVHTDLMPACSCLTFKIN